MFFFFPPVAQTQRRDVAVMLLSLYNSQGVLVNFFCWREALNIDVCMLRHLLVHLLASGHAVLPLLYAATRVCFVSLCACSPKHIHVKCTFLHSDACILFYCNVSVHCTHPQPPKARSHSVGATLSAPPSSLNVPLSIASQVLLSRWANTQIMTHPHVIISDYCHITVIASDCQTPCYYTLSIQNDHTVLLLLFLEALCFGSVTYN